MQILNILLLILCLPFAVVCAVLCRSKQRGHTLRQVCGIAAAAGFAAVAVIGVESLIGLTADVGVFYSGIEWLRLACLAVLVTVAAGCVLAVLLRKRPMAAFISGAATAAVVLGGTALFLYFKLTAVNAQFISLALVITLLFIPYAVFWLANMLLAPVGKAQGTVLTVVQAAYAATVAALLTYAFEALSRTEVAQIDVVGILLTALLVAVVAWPALVSGGSVLSERLKDAVQNKK